MNESTANVQLSTMTAGEHFIYAGLEFVVLEHTTNGTVVITADCVCDRPFDDWDSGNDPHNSWKTSTLKQWLNSEFFEKMLQNGASEPDIVPMIFDLSGYGKLSQYGTDESKIRLMGQGDYERYIKLLPPIDDWWWLRSPSSSTNGAMCVKTDGTYGSGHCGYVCGVRPLCILKSLTEVTK